jgi:hypothetical protein
MTQKKDPTRAIVGHMSETCMIPVSFFLGLGTWKKHRYVSWATTPCRIFSLPQVCKVTLCKHILQSKSRVKGAIPFPIQVPCHIWKNMEGYLSLCGFSTGHTFQHIHGPNCIPIGELEFWWHDLPSAGSVPSAQVPFRSPARRAAKQAWLLLTVQGSGHT